VNLVIIAVISALISLGAATSGTPQIPATTAAGSGFLPLPTPTPTPTPAPAPYDVISGGGPTH
jgi:hypothetical protein